MTYQQLSKEEWEAKDNAGYAQTAINFAGVICSVNAQISTSPVKKEEVKKWADYAYNYIKKKRDLFVSEETKQERKKLDKEIKF